MSSPTSHPLVGAAIARATAIGAAAGVVMVFVPSVAAIVLTGQSPDLLGVAALAAGFGGAGFGAMLGGVVTAVRVHADEEPGRGLR